MSIHVLCPSCEKVSEIHIRSVTQCSHCHRPLPESIRESALRTLEASDSPKPQLLVIGQWMSLVAALMIFGILASAPFDAGSYRINGVAVSGPTFVRQAGLGFGAIGLTLLGVSYGLFFEHRWVRALMVGYWPVVFGATWALSDNQKSDALLGVLFFGAAASVAAWYLYRRPNVRAYFEMLSRVSGRVDV